MADTNDPFLQVQADVLALLNTTRPLLQSYLRIRTSAASPDNPELREARNELASNVQDLQTDLQDLVASVRAVEGDPYKYGLEVVEVERRRQLVKDVGEELEEMHQELQQTVQDVQARSPGQSKSKGKGKGKAIARDGVLPDPDEFVHGNELGGEEDGGDSYGQFEQQRQMEIMAEQDQALEGVFKTVGNLRAQADSMGRELEEQAELLDSVDDAMDRVGGKLQSGLRNLKRVVEQNEDTYSSCCIWLLIFVLIMLLVLALVL